MSIRVEDSDIYKISSGKIRGKCYNIDNCRSYVSFLGIPYAKPPVGELRFQKPQPPESWRGVHNCKHFGAPCPYYEIPGSEYKPRLAHSEDCLFLNVFAPHNYRTGTPKNLPVLVFIHGGGYVFDNAANYGDANICQYLCSKDLVVVTINYRLGLFGYLTTNDDNARGNYGLWDQTEALKWVKENIKVFGGDPENITVSGHSAGGSSTELLALSPHSRNLFHRMILFGGAVDCGFAMVSPQYTRKKVLNFVKLRGFVHPQEGFSSTFEENKAIIAFIKTLPADKLKLGFSVVGGLGDFQMHIAPVIDGDFFPKSIDELRREALKKEILAGITKYEGLSIALAKDSKGLTKITLRMLAQFLRSNDKALVKKVFDEFIAKRKFGTDEYNEFCVQILSDLFITSGLWESAYKWASNGSKTFLFTFDYFKKGMLGTLGKFTPFEDCCHGVEISYLFGTSMFGEFKVEQSDYPVINNFTTVVVNFVKSGDPNKLNENAFKPITGNNGYLHTQINSKNISLDDFSGKRSEKWGELKKKYTLKSKF